MFLRAAALVLVLSSFIHARNIQLGAQIWIEPGQTAEQIDGWFATLEQAHMPVARVWVVWPYIEKQRDQWDWTLYDLVFRAAERHKVAIVATLTPENAPAFRPGALSSEQALHDASLYIHNVVERYKGSAALDTWMLLNEPGMPPRTDDLSVARFRAYLAKEYSDVGALNTTWQRDFKSFADVTASVIPAKIGEGWNHTPSIDWLNFWRTQLTFQLQWIADEIRRNDSKHPLHVNPHALISNSAMLGQDLPAWRNMLDTFGASVHPAWHFGLLKRDEFAMGVGYIADLIHGAAGDKPYWATELQGGNNIYSATRPMNPTREDIAQWVWTSIGAGNDRTIFWLLNARGQGLEAGEWSMLDFEQRPSERLTVASEIAKVVERNASLFRDTKAASTPFTILLSMETMTLDALHTWPETARQPQAHLLSALAYYKAFSDLGVPVRVRYMHEYDWTAASSEPRMAIVPHATAMSESEAKLMTEFVQNGNTLLITGLSGIYDERERFRPLATSSLDELLGGRLKEVNLVDERTETALSKPAITLPVSYWVSTIDNKSATPIAQNASGILGVRHQFGKGEAIWIPSAIELGSRFIDEPPLAQLVVGVSESFLKQTPVRFVSRQHNCLLRTLVSPEHTVAVITNGGAEQATCALRGVARNATVLWGESQTFHVREGTAELGPRATVVISW
jgi:beta-galactosidase